MTEWSGAPASALGAGLGGRCPRCGQGKLYSGYLNVRPRCEMCDLDYSFADSGDGPAIFVMLFVGFVVVAAALTVEVNFSPPLWLHMALWIPLILILALGALRPLKSLMISQQFHRQAREGRLS